MKKIFLLIIFIPIVLLGKSLVIPDEWPRYDSNLSAEQMYDAGQQIMIGWRRYQAATDDEQELVSHLASLRLRYIHESAERGYSYAIEWCTRDAYRQVCACLEQISASRIERLTAQAGTVSDADLKESCDNFLRQIRESGRIITERGQIE